MAPLPLQLHFPELWGRNEKGRTEEIEFHNLDTTTHNFVFPNLEVGHGKIKTENMQIRLSQVHEILNMCMNWRNYQHPIPTYSRVLRREKENDRGKKCNLTCRRCTRCWNFAQIWHPSPYNYIFRSFEVGSEKGRTEENVNEMLNSCMNLTTLIAPLTLLFSRILKWVIEKNNWNKCKLNWRRCMEWCRYASFDATRKNLPGPVIAWIDRLRVLLFDSIGGGACCSYFVERIVFLLAFR